ncbi:hypothetical protein P5E90_11920 [Clostridium perfringens]|nr:hypothetical protein [Clostridium perfringens]
MDFKISNRDRTKCKNCQWGSYLQCVYVKLNGVCSLTGVKVAKDYTYGRSLMDSIVHK